MYDCHEFPQIHEYAEMIKRSFAQISGKAQAVVVGVLIAVILAGIGYSAWDRWGGRVADKKIELGALVYPVIGYDRDTGAREGGLGTAVWNEPGGPPDPGRAHGRLLLFRRPWVSSPGRRPHGGPRV